MTNETLRAVDTVLGEMRQEHGRQRNICYTFAMDALVLEHYDLLARINRQALKHHERVMATFEVWERLAE